MNLAAFDYLNDLQVNDLEEFTSSFKPPTSLFCIIGGGLSKNLSVVKSILLFLSKQYKGVFYIDGAHEHYNYREYSRTIANIQRMIEPIPNVAYLHNNVIVVDGIAIIGINGWYGNTPNADEIDQQLADHFRRQDTLYLCNSIEKIQRHPDVKQVIIVSNSIPTPELSFNTITDLPCEIGLQMALMLDTENKIKCWLYGSYQGSCEVKKSDILYVCNTKTHDKEYHPKRVRLWL